MLSGQQTHLFFSVMDYSIRNYSVWALCTYTMLDQTRVHMKYTWRCIFKLFHWDGELIVFLMSYSRLPVLWDVRQNGKGKHVLSVKVECNCTIKSRKYEASVLTKFSLKTRDLILTARETRLISVLGFALGFSFQPRPTAIAWPT